MFNNTKAVAWRIYYPLTKQYVLFGQYPSYFENREDVPIEHLYNISVVPTEEMIKAGQNIASSITDAMISKHMNGLGGSKTEREWQLSEHKNVDLILMYLNGEVDSVTAIYMAMVRELNNA